MPSSKLIVPTSFVLLIFVAVPVLAEANNGDSNSTETRRGQRNGCENMSDDEVEANAYRLTIGILIAIIGGLVSSFGLVFQKYAHKLNEASEGGAWKLQGYYRLHHIHFRDCNLFSCFTVCPTVGPCCARIS